MSASSWDITWSAPDSDGVGHSGAAVINARAPLHHHRRRDAGPDEHGQEDHHDERRLEGEAPAIAERSPVHGYHVPSRRLGCLGETPGSACRRRRRVALGWSGGRHVRPTAECFRHRGFLSAGDPVSSPGSVFRNAARASQKAMCDFWTLSTDDILSKMPAICHGGSVPRLLRIYPGWRPAVEMGARPRIAGELLQPLTRQFLAVPVQLSAT